ncbi:MAG: glycosyltransferase [Holophaga sp.]|nr:glycosyltransferase [Holophaga sp.]
MLQLLEPHYDITLAFLAPEAALDDGCLAAHAGQDFAVLLCWQVLPPMPTLARVGCRHMVFFPMFDQSGRWSREQWSPYRGLKIVSFSSTLARQLRHWGFDAHYFQFFPEPGPALPPGDPHKAFFWNRNEKINLDTVTRLLSGSGVQDLHVHRALDPGQRFLPAGGPAAGQLTLEFSQWFATKAEMQAKIGECALYFAPRKYEGIGMSFLEAMAMGRCVVAPDHPTMNEYIRHGVNGLLYNPKKPAPLSLDNLSRIQRQARDFMVAGHAQWQAARTAIVPLLESPARTGSYRRWLFLGLVGLRFPFTRFMQARQWLFSIRVRPDGWKIRCCGLTWSRERPPREIR